MTHADYTLEDLADRTGFTPRQIRYYITRQLAPGAGERGPHVRYGDETLRRLLLVARLKELRIQPTGRTPSLDEIAKMIDSLDDASADRLLDGEMELAIVDTEAEQPAAVTSRLRAPSLPFDDDMSLLQVRQPGPSFLRCEESLYEAAPPPPDLGPLRDPLSRLRELLGEMVELSPSPDAGESWRRIRTPDIEIHVRAPGDAARRERLGRALAALKRLLDEEVRR